MKILLTGSTGYIGRRLLPVLVQKGHHVVCLVRDQRRFDHEDFTADFMKNVTLIEADLTEPKTLDNLPLDIEAAYYLVHSLTNTSSSFHSMELETARNFIDYLEKTEAQQLIYLGGIANDASLSAHLESRREVGDVLKSSSVPVTILRAAIIIGSGSASFEIVRDLVEKLPVMVAPKWISTKCQPIGIRNVIEYLNGVLGNEECLGQVFDIGGPDVLTYKAMMLEFAKMRGLKRYIITVPVLTPRLSSLWLYFVTSTSFGLARNLVDSMRNEVICEDSRIQEIIPLELYPYKETLEMAFSRISQKNIVSSWKDAILNDAFDKNFLDFVEVPEHGCMKDRKAIPFDRPKEEVIKNIWTIGGERGWYYGNFLWKIRGFLDQLVGGVGLRRGRRSPTDLKAGDALDFWRVLLADEKTGRLLLYAEMKLPGEAWLEFKIKEEDQQQVMYQTATFRPRGIWGRMYWYLLVPAHLVIFSRMARNIVKS